MLVRLNLVRKILVKNWLGMPGNDASIRVSWQRLVRYVAGGLERPVSRINGVSWGSDGVLGKRVR